MTRKLFAGQRVYDWGVTVLLKVHYKMGTTKENKCGFYYLFMTSI